MSLKTRRVAVCHAFRETSCTKSAIKTHFFEVQMFTGWWLELRVCAPKDVGVKSNVTIVSQVM